jgi:hypothetical protein
MKKIFMTLLIILVILSALAAYLFLGQTKPAAQIGWGVVFSQKHAKYLGLDWQKTYLAILDGLGAREIKVASYWDLLEPENGFYNFTDLDWQIEEAGKRGANVLLVLGMKSPRWPECHIPDWALGLDKAGQQEKIMEMLKVSVLHYRESDVILGWQVENGPFFIFGECPWADPAFLEKEISLIKSLDKKSRPIIVSDSGEGPFWFRAAKVSDIVGITMYKKVWVSQLGTYFTYPFPPVFYHRKAEIIRRLFHKEVICVELQAEPWAPQLLYDTPLKEQEKTMNLEQFRYNIDFAQKTGLSKFYLWGAEWWYWLKEKQQKPEIWEEAGKLF